MRFFSKILILLSFIAVLGAQNAVQAEIKGIMDWGKSHKMHSSYKEYRPYLENARHLQIPQWAHEDWYVEDWTSQVPGMTLIEGWYEADILRDQKIGHAELPVLVVGPNFYHLSGLDKRRVVTTVDATYGMTSRADNAAFMLTDWYTNMPIGVFDRYGLRLH